jgi:PAS domain S-box-containing protein
MHYKVLIAGDNIKSLTVLRKSLELFTHQFTVFTTVSSEIDETINSVGWPDIIILQFEDMIEKGLLALSLIKGNQKTKNIPVLMITDFLSYKVQQAITAGADDFIKKPIERVELMIRIKYLVQRNRLYLENLKQSEELKKLSLVADRSENSVLITNALGELEWVNKAFERLYEYSLEDFKVRYGNKLQEISNKFSEAMSRCKKDRKWLVYDNCWVNKNGDKKWIQTSLTPIIADNGELTNFIAVETDITPLKLAEERLRDQNQDLVDITVSVEQINKKLEEKQKEVNQQKKLVEEQKKMADNLLKNIFPYEIAEQLKLKGYAIPKHYRLVSIMFTDFAGFAKLSDQLSVHDLIKELSMYFEKFDSITSGHYIEKIKTIGDSYMCAGGLPIRNRSNPIDTALAALEIQKFVKESNREKQLKNQPKWEIRLGIHTGEVIAGVIGKTKINISGSTYMHIKKYFDCTYRGKIDVRNKGQIDMYFLNRLKKEYCTDNEGIMPNSPFKKILSEY